VTNRRTDRRRELRWLTRTTAVAAVARNKVMTSEALAGEKQRQKKTKAQTQTKAVSAPSNQEDNKCILFHVITSNE